MGGPAVLITGASSGIGRAFAERHAASGAELVLVARREARLKDLAASLSARYGSAINVIPADLSTADGAAKLAGALATRQIEVGTLINNAGVGDHGDVVTANPASLVAQITLNVSSLTELTARLLPAMVERGEGQVINVASTAAFQPVPHMAVYAATKAYVLSFTRALWAETRGTGVKVLALCPGATDTEFFDIVGEAASVGNRRSPEQVVSTAERAIRRDRPSVVDGKRNAALAHVATRLPERIAINAAERSVRP